MIRNINERFGDQVEFDSVEEMEEALRKMGYLGECQFLTAGKDYEVINETR